MREDAQVQGGREAADAVLETFGVDVREVADDGQH